MFSSDATADKHDSRSLSLASNNACGASLIAAEETSERKLTNSGVGIDDRSRRWNSTTGGRASTPPVARHSECTTSTQLSANESALDRVCFGPFSATEIIQSA